MALLDNIADKDGSAQSSKHYQVCEIEPIEIMQMYFPRQEVIGFLKCNILKYNLRYGHKDPPPKEAAKIAQYSKWLAIVENGGKINPREE